MYINTNYIKVKHSQLIRLLVIAKLHTYPCDSNLMYRNFVTFAVSPIISHLAIMAASTGIVHSVASKFVLSRLI